MISTYPTVTTAHTSLYHVGFASKLLTHHWVGSILFAVGTHLALWYLPVRMPSQKPQTSRPIRLVLQPVQPPPPVQPKRPPRPRTLRKDPPKPRPQKRRLQRRRIVQKQPVIKKPIPTPQRIPPRPVPRRIVPMYPHRTVAKLTTPKAVLPVPVAPPAPVTKTPVTLVDLRPYGRSLYQSILRQKRYPPMAARMGYEGTVILVIRVSAQGKLLGQPRIVRSSGFDLLDQEAVRMIQAAAPWPAMPTGFSQRFKTFRMPVRFSLHG